jgi:hypothetical protein
MIAPYARPLSAAMLVQGERWRRAKRALARSAFWAPACERRRSRMADELNLNDYTGEFRKKSGHLEDFSREFPVKLTHIYEDTIERWWRNKGVPG